MTDYTDHTSDDAYYSPGRNHEHSASNDSESYRRSDETYGHDHDHEHQVVDDDDNEDRLDENDDYYAILNIPTNVCCS